MKKTAAQQARAASDGLDGLEVWLDDIEAGPLTHIGRLHRDGSAVRFEYARRWLRHPSAFELDPELMLASGSFHPKESNFGIFLDSCPDRWGQTLMKRRELVEARQQRRVARTLTLWDFFLGVQDVARMGALRFSALQSDRGLAQSDSPPEFVDGAALANEMLAAPPLAHLEELQAVALELTRNKVDNLGLLEQWLKVLVAPGASLGGARPKANLRDNQARLWIAKFPAADDEHDWALREMLLHRLAQAFGLNVAPARLVRIGASHHTFVTQRFDRQNGRRRFFTSAMAVLGRDDGEGASYLDLAQFIGNRHGVAGHIEHDLLEMFRRVLFNVAVANRDDHLRNHGFIRHAGGWRLAPAFDINPSVDKAEHVLAIDDQSTLPDLDTVVSTHDFYRLRKADALAERDRLHGVLRGWERRAKTLGLSAEDRLALRSGLWV